MEGGPPRSTTAAPGSQGRPRRQRPEQLGEWRARTKPRKADSDRDGFADGDEDVDGDGLSNAEEDALGLDPRSAGDGGLAGTVAAFDGTTLVIALARGGAVSGLVDADTEVWCDVQAGYEDEYDEGDDDSDRFTVTARLAEEGDEDDAGDEDWSDQDDADCAAELAPGAVVHEAELEDGRFWTVELVLADQVRPA